MTPDGVAGSAATARPRTTRSTVVLALVPLLLLAGLLVVLTKFGPSEALRLEGQPPIERLVVQQARLDAAGFHVAVLNDGPDEVTIAQVQVDEAYWSFSANRGATLRHLGETTISIPYPWVPGEAHTIRLVTSTGTTFDYEIGVALATPTPNLPTFGLFTLIGVYVGVIPVAIGLLWLPWMARLGRSGFDFLLALTIGLLVFLLVDAATEGLEAASTMPESYQGVVLFAFTAVGAYLGIEQLGGWLRRRRSARSAGGVATAGWVLALLIAVGIGVHNFGEGLAIGAAFRLGEFALGSLLIVGFALHNTTEGLAIVAPLARTAPKAGRPASVWDLVRLGLIGGVPTIAGAWLGGLVYSPVWSVVFLAIGVGAIAQVVAQIVRQMSADRSTAAYFATPAVVSGLAAGFLVMYVTGMIIG